MVRDILLEVASGRLTHCRTTSDSPTLFIRLQWSGSPTWSAFTAMEFSTKPERRRIFPRVRHGFSTSRSSSCSTSQLAAAGPETRTERRCFPKLCKSITCACIDDRLGQPLQSYIIRTHRPLHPVRLLSQFQSPGKLPANPLHLIHLRRN